MGVVQNALSAGTSNLITHGAKIEKKKNCPEPNRISIYIFLNKQKNKNKINVNNSK